jgi:hypothetical protein
MTFRGDAKHALARLSILFLSQCFGKSPRLERTRSKHMKKGIFSLKKGLKDSYILAPGSWLLAPGSIMPDHG